MDSFLQKLRFKEAGIALNVPEKFKNIFLENGFSLALNPAKKNRNVFAFFYNKQEYLNQIETIIENLEFDTAFWLAYPKGTSALKTDINRDILWKLTEPFAYRPVTNVAIDETWSGLRFRPLAAYEK